MEDKIPGINFNSWLNSNTKHGLPLNKIKNGSLHYWYPRDGAVAWFYADSGRARLDCNWNPTFSVAVLGVRRAKIFRG